MPQGDNGPGTVKRNHDHFTKKVVKNSLKNNDKKNDRKRRSRRSMPRHRSFSKKLMDKMKTRVDAKQNVEEKAKVVTRNINVVDTNVLIQDPESLDILRAAGDNILVVPGVVLEELDNLKNEPGVGIEAREASRRIEALQEEEAHLSDEQKSLKIFYQENWSGLEILPHDKVDYRILANFNSFLREEAEPADQVKHFDKFKLISKDRNLRIVAREFLSNKMVAVAVEDYYQDQSKGDLSSELIVINVPGKIIKCDDKDNKYWFELKDLSQVDQDKVDNLAFCSGILCRSDWDGCFTKNRAGKYKDDVLKNCAGSFSESFAAIYYGDVFTVVDKEIKASNLGQYTINGNGPNWHQIIALQQLLDPDIAAVFLQGGAGTGKTLLAMAAALEQDSIYDSIIVTRSQVPSDGKDRNGFLPGNIAKKLDPWLKPTYQAVDLIRKAQSRHSVGNHFQDGIYSLNEKFRGNKNSVQNNVDKFDKLEKLKEEERFIIQPLDYIRGQSIVKSFVVVDEAQNLTPREVKTIVTRVGQGTKIVFTGDLTQIDHPYLDRKSSGLAYAIERMSNKENILDPDLEYGPTIVAYTNFKESVRSPLARYAEKVL